MCTTYMYTFSTTTHNMAAACLITHKSLLSNVDLDFILLDACREHEAQCINVICTCIYYMVPVHVCTTDWLAVE